MMRITSAICLQARASRPMQIPGVAMHKGLRSSVRAVMAHASTSQHNQRHAMLCRSLPVDLDLDAMLDNIDMPDIDGDLRSVQAELGARFDDQGVVVTYGNPRQAVAAIESGVVLVDQSHWGRLRIAGEDRLSFLQNCSTNDFTQMHAGQGCDTVFVNSNGCALDLGTTLFNESSLLLLTSPGGKQLIQQHLQQQIKPDDKVKVQDITDRCVMLTLIGPEAKNVLQEVAGETITVTGQPYGTHQLVQFKSGPLIVAVGSSLTVPGYTLIVDESSGGDLFALLTSKGCVLMGEDEWEITRVLAGRPALGAELTGAETPIEAGLGHAVSLRKGGQVTSAPDSQQLWGLSLDSAVGVGEAVQAVDGTPLGTVTSTATTPTGTHWALTYLPPLQHLEGLSVTVGGVRGRVVSIPFATRQSADSLPDGFSGPGAQDKLRQIELEGEAAAAAMEATATAKVADLRAMQERWQAQQAKLQKQ